MSETTPSPYDLWVQAGEDGDRYRQLLREHGHLLSPGDEGYGEGSRNLPCGWPGREEPAIVSVSTPSDLTDKALAAVNRLHDIVHPFRSGEGVYEPERNPGGCDKVFCCAILPEVPAVVEPAIRADERERIAALADAEAARGAKTGLDRISLRAFAARLRKEAP